MIFLLIKQGMDKSMKKFLVATAILLFAILKANMQLMAAGGQWQWEATLQDTKERGAMHMPTAIHIDPALERYYVIDSGNNRILTYDRKGEFFRAFDAGNQMLVPFDLENEQGVLWLVEKGRNSLTRIDLEARKIVPKTFSDQGVSVFPDRLEADKNYLYLLNKAKGNILALNRELEVVKRFSCGECEGGFVDFKIRHGNLWALEQKSKKIYKFSMTGNIQDTIQLEESAIDFPRSIEVDENGFFFLLDRHKGAVAVFDVNGSFRYRFMEQGQARGQLYYPVEIKFDPWGRLCIVDEGNGRVQIFSRR